MTHFIKKFISFGVGSLALLQALPVLATAYSSTNYQILDPAIQVGGVGSSSSTSYGLIGTLGEVAVGNSSSVSYYVMGGSLPYPYCTSPTLSATPRSGAVRLTFTSATCSGGSPITSDNGWNIDHYEYCVGTTSDNYSLGCTTATSPADVVAPGGAVRYYRISTIVTEGTGTVTGSRSNELLAVAGVTGGGGGGGGGAGGGTVTALTVSSPNGSEQWVTGTSHNITWASTGTGISTIRLRYSTDGGLTFPNIIATNESNDGTYAWTVPSITTSTARVVVEGMNASNEVTVSDMSNSNFAIGPAGAVPEPTPTPTVTPTQSTGGATPSSVSLVTVNLRGYSYPNATVTVLRDGVNAGFVAADASGAWSMTMPGLTPGGLYSFVFYATDSVGRRSANTSRTVTLPTNAPTYNIENLLISPTIAASASSVQPGTPIDFSGSAVPASTLNVEFNDMMRNLAVAANGLWDLSRGTQGISGNFTARARVNRNGEYSTWSESVAFSVSGTAVNPPTVRSADINGDRRINLTDFSRLVAYWLSATAPDNVDLNDDGVVNLRDLSILLYRWTG